MSNKVGGPSSDCLGVIGSARSEAGGRPRARGVRQCRSWPSSSSAVRCLYRIPPLSSGNAFNRRHRLLPVGTSGHEGCRCRAVLDSSLIVPAEAGAADGRPRDTPAEERNPNKGTPQGGARAPARFCWNCAHVCSRRKREAGLRLRPGPSAPGRSAVCRRLRERGLHRGGCVRRPDARESAGVIAALGSCSSLWRSEPVVIPSQ
jgi:hypothetical protein